MEMRSNSDEIITEKAYLIDIAALAAAIWNLYKLPYFSTLSLTRQRKKIRMDPQVNLFYTSKRDCMQNLLLVFALLER